MPVVDSSALDLTRITGNLGDAIAQVVTAHGETTLITTRERVIDVLAYLRDGEQFEMLTDETCVDYYPKEPRFAIVYQLNSLSRRLRVRVKVFLTEYDKSIPTATDIYPSANWAEREIYDLFGVIFEGHPDLRRIVLPAGYEGHPLLKEVPVTVEEVAFSFNRRRIDADKPYARE
ncbi:MAG: NADH-quinone oxidoreductase subunit C [Anaerolineae bacterium]|nr:NADH-quinone oxidoreductase subunit C [Thermoflexales bacterium]MDW8407936.1 NADH-quinone oxidoreductase subunit C [Anaerolineae bacterium]